MELKTNEIINEEIESNEKEIIEDEEEKEKDNTGVDLDEENTNEEEEEDKENENEQLSLTSPKKRIKRIKYITFDEKYDYNSHYFYQELKENELKEISEFIEKFLSEKSINKTELINFFSNYPNIIKGNVEKLKEILNQSSEKYPNLSSYKIINDFIITEYYIPKPSICECYFFPDGSNEYKVVNILRTCKKSLDIAIYTFTLESITKAVIEVYNRGIPVRIICDNECEKKSTSKIKKLASIGIVCKTDNCSYYMHHKFAIIDNSVIITGSFNWSSQAVNHNEENILFLENKDIAQEYTNEFNKLWNNFDTIINMEEAKKYTKEKEEKDKIKKEKLENKLKRQKERIAKKQEKEKLSKQKEMEKLEKQKENKIISQQKEIEKLEKQKENKIKSQQKEIEKLEKQKEKIQKEIEKLEKQKEKLKISQQKEIEKLEKQKEKAKISQQKEIGKFEKQKEKVKISQQKEIEKFEKQKEKEKKEIEKLGKQKEKEQKEIEKLKEKKEKEKEKEKDKEKDKEKEKEKDKEKENPKISSNTSKKETIKESPKSKKKGNKESIEN